jgi:hypothetical protein
MAPTYTRSNLFQSDAKVIGVTTNSFVAQNQRLVMGRGAALALAKQKPQFPFHAGRYIMNTCGHLGKYGWFSFPADQGKRFGCFQVKYNWRDQADLGLIRYSVDMLNAWIFSERQVKVSINFPGIGNGRRNIEQVFQIVDQLSPFVSIHYFEDEVEATLKRLVAEAYDEVPF